MESSSQSLPTRSDILLGTSGYPIRPGLDDRNWMESGDRRREGTWKTDHRVRGSDEEVRGRGVLRGCNVCVRMCSCVRISTCMCVRARPFVQGRTVN